MIIVPAAILGGLLIGWIVSVIVGPSYYHRVIINLIVGIVGALIWGQLMAPVFGYPSLSSGYFTWGGLWVAWGGAAITLLLIGAIVRAGSR